MLLRRINEHVTNQNWFAVGLDFLIVVFGVFIGLQVANWNETRKDQSQEQLVIARLSDDFVSLSRDLDEKIANLELANKGIEDMQKLIIDFPNAANQEHVRFFLEHSFKLENPVGHSETYSQLVSSGDMNLITNKTLRNTLMRHATLTNTLIQRDQARREWLRPYIMPLYRLLALNDTMPFRDAYNTAGSKADLIVAIHIYKSVFRNQVGDLLEQKKSISKLNELLASKQNSKATGSNKN